MEQLPQAAGVKARIHSSAVWGVCGSVLQGRGQVTRWVDAQASCMGVKGERTSCPPAESGQKDWESSGSPLHVGVELCWSHPHHVSVSWAHGGRVVDARGPAPYCVCPLVQGGKRGHTLILT